MNSLYQQFASWYQSFMNVWPADMRTMDVRYSSTPPAAHIPHIWCGLVGQSTLYTGTQTVGTSVGTNGMQGWLDTKTQNWVPAANLTAAEKAALIVPVTLLQNGAATKTVTPDSTGNFSATLTSPNAGVVHYNWQGKTGDTGPNMTMTWVGEPTAASTPSIVSVDGKTLDVFVIGSDKACWWRHWDGAAWAGWVSLGGICTAPPCAVTEPGHLDIFVRGSDGHPYQKSYVNGKWNAWYQHDGLIHTGTGVTACWVGTTLYLYVQGTDNALWSKNWNGSIWSKWSSQGGTL
jgi:hypothetical protein